MNNNCIDLFVVRPVRYVFSGSDYVSTMDILYIPGHKPLAIINKLFLMVAGLNVSLELFLHEHLQRFAFLSSHATYPVPEKDINSSQVGLGC